MKRPLVFSMLIPALALAAAAMACNIEAVGQMVLEAYDETCYRVDRAEYERAATELGQVPETPKYPELVIYEVCYFIDKDRRLLQDDPVLSSVRMSEGYRPEESDPAASQPAEVRPTLDDLNADDAILDPLVRDYGAGIEVAPLDVVQRQLASRFLQLLGGKGPVLIRRGHLRQFLDGKHRVAGQIEPAHEHPLADGKRRFGWFG